MIEPPISSVAPSADVWAPRAERGGRVMTRNKLQGLVVLVLVLALNGALLTRLIRKRFAAAEASSEQIRQVQLELVGEAKMQRLTPIRCIGSLTQDRYW